MKVYTATLFKNNYGSVLQAYALQQKLRELGAESVIIEHEFSAKPQKISTIQKLIRLFKPEKHYGPLRKIKRVIQKKHFANKIRKINRFVAENITSAPYDDCYHAIMQGNCVLLAGSDQVWSIISHPIKGFYLFDYAPEDSNVHKTSYAASIGLSELSEEQIAYYREVLKDFESVSFREKEAYELLHDQLENKNVRSDIDPTLLYDAGFWGNLTHKPPVEGKYIFVYMLRPDNKLIQMAKKIARESGSKVIFTGQFADKYAGVETVTDLGVEDFLSYIRYAEAVVTNSFHGTVFSVLFEKKFASVQVESTSSRARNLLRMVDLENHLISAEQDVDVVWDAIDYEKVRLHLSEVRECSVAYLRQIAQMANGE